MDAGNGRYWQSSGRGRKQCSNCGVFVPNARRLCLCGTEFGRGDGAAAGLLTPKRTSTAPAGGEASGDADVHEAGSAEPGEEEATALHAELDNSAFKSVARVVRDKHDPGAAAASYALGTARQIVANKSPLRSRSSAVRAILPAHSYNTVTSPAGFGLAPSGLGVTLGPSPVAAVRPPSSAAQASLAQAELLETVVAKMSGEGGQTDHRFEPEASKRSYEATAAALAPTIADRAAGIVIPVSRTLPQPHSVRQTLNTTAILGTAPVLAMPALHQHASLLTTGAGPPFDAFSASTPLEELMPRPIATAPSSPRPVTDYGPVCPQCGALRSITTGLLPCDCFS